MSQIYVGTAAWTLPATVKDRFPIEGSHLERYAQRCGGVEINSSFYRDHKATTYARWARSVPETFRFAVKLSREITHEKKLKASEEDLRLKMEAIGQLGKRLGPLLVQLPPSLKYEPQVVPAFFAKLRKVFSGDVVCEPRHLSWTNEEARHCFRRFAVSKVSADPEPCPVENAEAWFNGCAYFRWHGSPEVYRSQYGNSHLEALASTLRKLSDRAISLWAIFDNTTFGYATGDALKLMDLLDYDKKRTGIARMSVL